MNAVRRTTAAREGRPSAAAPADAAPPRPRLVTPASPEEAVAEAVARWRERLVAQVGGSTLADVGLLGDAVIDLSAAHPSGVAQLFAGRPTRLTNLLRERAALPAARRRARAVSARSAEHAQRFGVAPTYLAIGVATWTEPVGGPPPSSGLSQDVAALARVTAQRDPRPTEADATEAATDASDAAAPGPLGPGQASETPVLDATPAAHAATDVAATSDAPSDPAATDADDTLLLTQSLPVVTVAARAAATAPGPDRATDRVGAGARDASAGTQAVRVVHAPVLLRPVTLTPRGDGEADYDLTLEATAELNPVVARTLRAHGALLDPASLAQATFSTAGFDPSDVLDRIAALGEAVLDGFTLDRRMLVGTFVHPGQALVDDIDELASSLARHEVVAALAGVDAAAAAVTALQVPAPARGDAPPAQERGVGDLDPSQRHVVDALATGGHLYVDAPVGSDAAGTVAAVVAEATAAGRSVLYVTGHRRAADALAARLASLDLDGLLLDVPPVPTWRQEVARRLLTAMASEPEPLDDDGVAQLRDALIGAGHQLAGYIAALHQSRAPWQVSAYDALQALARLTADRPAPSTSVRLAPSTVVALSGDARRAVAADLQQAAELGAFTLRATSTPWFDALLLTDDDAREALVRVRRLKDTTLPQLRRQVAFVTEITGLTPPTTVGAFGEQLTMLGGMRGTLDLFHPMVFERTAADMVQATATRKWRAEHGVEMGWFTRRRLRKHAKDMVRPGVRVPDMHAALREVQAQREVWAQHAERGGWPTLPEGLATIEDTHEAVRIDLDALEPVLTTTPLGGGLADLALDGLAERLERLAADADSLDTLPARTAALRRARAAGVGELVDDLIARRVDVSLVIPELELAWWSSVFEQLLAADPALAGQDGAGLDALARRFRELDRRHVASLSGPVRAAVRAHLGAAMRDDRADAEALFTELIEGRLTSLRDLATRHGEVLRRLRPAVVATPTLVPRLLPAVRTVDLVVLDAIQHVPLETVVPALARGRQIVVIGDVRSASGTAVLELAGVLPHVTVQPRESRRDPELTRLLARHGYAGLVRPAPLPRAEALVHLDLVDGSGMPDPSSGTVESTQAEVDRVVELAIEHALTRPEETLGIVTVTSVHADRIREALLAEVRANPALAPFFSGARPEPVVVADVTGVSGLSRDAIVLSLGFGRTPHGRVLHRFGVLSEPGGDAMLLGALGATRRRLRVVTCFLAGDLDPERLRGAGPRLLAEVLQFAQVRSDVADQVALGNGVDVSSAPDRLLVDLGERLWRLGYLVETDYGLPDGDRIPLVVGHPDLPGELLVAVLTDDDAYVAEPSVRVRARQVAERLERLGWVVTQVWSAAAFLDPDGEADRVRGLVQRVRDERIGTAGGVVPPREVVVPHLPAEDDDEDEAPFAGPAAPHPDETAAPARDVAGEPEEPDRTGAGDTARVVDGPDGNAVALGDETRGLDEPDAHGVRDDQAARDASDEEPAAPAPLPSDPS
ncbi:hypothetical protein [Xylanimonas allomyrinae]|uniref:hypothetical protein n=1 Tax=Xylanimonas allomyrinae TaxID=2509459 RepID=UPI001FE86755|nr:hypothetical protein [Xylanimonas allomyrinae]